MARVKDKVLLNNQSYTKRFQFTQKQYTHEYLMFCNNSWPVWYEKQNDLFKKKKDEVRIWHRFVRTLKYMF